MAKSSKLINDPDHLIEDLISGMLSAHPNHLRLEGRTGRGLSTEAQCAKVMYVEGITKNESIYAINIAPNRGVSGTHGTSKAGFTVPQVHYFASTSKPGLRPMVCPVVANTSLR